MGLGIRFIRSGLALRLLTLASVAALNCAAVLPANSQQPASRTIIVTRLPNAVSSAVDAGPAPSSQRLSLTLTLAQTPAQSAALDQFLADLNTASSPSYHQWLTPQQFAATYGASADQLAAATAWLQSQGLTVDAVSPSATRISASGFTSQIEPAFATTIHNYQVNGHLYFANATPPSLPAEAASLFAAIDGLDNLPGDLGIGSDTHARTAINSQPALLSLPSLAALVDSNSTPILSLDATTATGSPSPSQISSLSALFRQAAAQGITTLVYGNTSYGYPEITAIAIPSSAAAEATPFAARPAWQIATGLPSDNLRDTPDLTADSLASFAQTIASIAIQTPTGRLGNINATLYSLAPLPGLYTQPDNAAPGTWEPATGLGLVDTAKLAKAYPRGTGPTNVQISSSAYSPTHGQSFVLTVTAASNIGGATPTGTVTFTAPQAGFNSTTATLNSTGIATSTAYVLPGGTYAITASYSGDANYAPSSGTVNITVQPEAAVFTITAPSTVSLGGIITATVTLASASGVGTPSASVTVTPSGITSAVTSTQTIAGTNGTATGTYTFTTNKAGSVSLQASCTSSDPSFTCFTPQTATITVPQATPTVALTMTPSNPVAGTSVTLSATVTGVAGIGTTGSVQFFDGATSLGFGSAPAATFSGMLTAGTTHVITAVYQGDSNYLKATSNAINSSVATAPTTTAVSASAATATFGQSVTLNISVSTTTVVNGTQPTGTLTFTGAGSTTSAPVSGGSAVVTLNNLGVGTYTIGTAYSGDTNYSASTGNTVTITITQATASISTNLSSTSFTTGSTSTLTVTVTLPGTALVPTGATFLATIAGVTGATYTGTFIPNVGGNTATGAVVIPAPPAGTYTMQVTCGTNANFTCTPNSLSISSTAVVTVGTGTTPTTTTFAISPLTPAFGQAVTLTATVSASATAIAANPLAGMVNFYDGTTLIGTGTIAPVVAGGATTYVATATYTFTGTTAAHSLTATYAGNTVYATSTSTVLAVTLSAASASVLLTSNVTTTIAGTSVVLTATVSGSTTSGAAPTGTVSFYITGASASLIGTATLGTIGNGVAQAVLSTPNLPAGAITIYATYNGDTNFSSAISNNLTLGLSDYALSFVPQTLAITQGQSGSATGVVTLINNFSGSVALGCTAAYGLEITCSFNPSILTGGGPTTLVVTTTATKGHAINGTEQSSLRVAGGAALAALLCCFLPGARRRRIPAMLLVLLALSLTMNLGCSTSVNTASPANAGTPLGTTLLTISTVGTNGSASVRHNYIYQVTIQ